LALPMPQCFLFPACSLTKLSFLSCWVNMCPGRLPPTSLGEGGSPWTEIGVLTHPGLPVRLEHNISPVSRKGLWDLSFSIQKTQMPFLYSNALRTFRLIRMASMMQSYRVLSLSNTVAVLAGLSLLDLHSTRKPPTGALLRRYP
jgi:hypothetical protein